MMEEPQATGHGTVLRIGWAAPPDGRMPRVFSRHIVTIQCLQAWVKMAAVTKASRAVTEASQGGAWGQGTGVRSLRTEITGSTPRCRVASTDCGVKDQGQKDE